MCKPSPIRERLAHLNARTLLPRLGRESFELVASETSVPHIKCKCKSSWYLKGVTVPVAVGKRCDIRGANWRHGPTARGGGLESIQKSLTHTRTLEAQKITVSTQNTPQVETGRQVEARCREGKIWAVRKITQSRLQCADSIPVPLENVEYNVGQEYPSFALSLLPFWLICCCFGFCECWRFRLYPLSKHFITKRWFCIFESKATQRELREGELFERKLGKDNYTVGLLGWYMIIMQGCKDVQTVFLVS